MPLDWDHREDQIKLPSVFSRTTGFVRRQLSDRELLAAMDVPASVLKQASEEELAVWKGELTVPFKSRFEIIRSVTEAQQDAGVKSETVHTGRRTAECRETQTTTPQPTAGRSSGSGGRPQTKGAAVDQAPRPGALGVQALTVSHLTAAKSDDAEVPVQVWDDRCRAGCARMEGALRLHIGDGESAAQEAWTRFLASMRIWMLQRWRRLVASSFWAWWAESRVARLSQGIPGVCELSKAPGLAALGHSVDASWWEWNRGSAPFFWRYPSEWLVLMRDGLPPRFVGTPPRYTKTQTPPRDLGVRAKEKAKVATVRQRGYVTEMPGLKALLNFFSVSKGESDIRMVYDGTASGLNAVLFAPWFALTTLSCMLRCVLKLTPGCAWRAIGGR